jgi:hypothetical protein
VSARAEPHAGGRLLPEHGPALGVVGDGEAVRDEAALFEVRPREDLVHARHPRQGNGLLLDRRGPVVARGFSRDNDDHDAAVHAPSAGRLLRDHGALRARVSPAHDLRRVAARHEPLLGGLLVQPDHGGHDADRLAGAVAPAEQQRSRHHGQQHRDGCRGKKQAMTAHG